MSTTELAALNAEKTRLTRRLDVLDGLCRTAGSTAAWLVADRKAQEVDAELQAVEQRIAAA